MANSSRFVLLSALGVTLWAGSILANVVSDSDGDLDSLAGLQPSVQGESALEKPMEDLKSGVKRLRRQLSGPEHAASARETLHKMQTAALECCKHDPSPLREMEAKELQLWNIQFRRGMLEVADILFELEAAVISEDQAQIQTLYRKLGAAKKSGHKEFQPEEE